MRRSLLSFIFLIALSYTFAQSGTPDRTFGDNGLATLPDGATAFTLVTQPDGKIVVSGFYRKANSDARKNFIARYNPDGTLDKSFSDDGWLAEDFFSSQFYDADLLHLAVQSDNKLVIAASKGVARPYQPENPNSSMYTSTDFAVVRFTEDGHRDNSFGNAGSVITNIDAINTGFGITYSFEQLTSIAVLTNGKIAVAGAYSLGDEKKWVRVVYNTDGTVADIKKDPGNNSDYPAPNITAYPNGGTVISFTRNQACVISSTTFGDVSLKFPNSVSSTAYGHIVTSDGKIVLVGACGQGFFSDNLFFLCRLNTDGSIDTTFGKNGFVRPFDGASNPIHIAQQSDDKIIVSNGYNVVRCNVDGSIDQSFGTLGQQVIGSYEIAYDNNRLYTADWTNLAAYILRNKPTTITCPKNTILYTAENAAQRFDYLPPVINPSENTTPVLFKLEGSFGDSGVLGADVMTYMRGITKVTYTLAIDPSQSCSFTVTVKDTIRPIINCLNNITVKTDSSKAGATVKWKHPDYYDNAMPTVARLDSNFVFMGTYKKHYYYYSRNVSGFSLAKAEAFSYGGDIVTIDDKGENEFIRKHIPYTGIPYMIGLNDRSEERKLVWSNGSQAKYRNWGGDKYAGEIVAPNMEWVEEWQNSSESDYVVMDIETGSWYFDPSYYYDVVPYIMEMEHPFKEDTLKQTSGPSSGSFFSLGTHKITYAITDPDGNSATCSFLVTVNGDSTGTTTWYRDADGDGWGDPNLSKVAAKQPRGYVSNKLDCNDKNKTKGGPEVCDGIDNDCDGLIDNGLAQHTFYSDCDGDGYGSDKRAITACAAPPRFVAVAGDCNDDNNTVYPGAPELCDGRDNDCNGKIDDGLTLKPFYWDGDKDGYGFQRPVYACAAPPGYIAQGGDFNDNDTSIHPGAVEHCDGVDEDCDGVIDDGFVQKRFYKDRDGDGWGSNSNMLAGCAPQGYVERNGDCNDYDAAVNPDADEVIGNGKDDNCNGQVDEAPTSVATLDKGTQKRVQEATAPTLTLSATPNPTSRYFTVHVQSNSQKPMSLRIVDAVGRVLEVHQGVRPNTTLAIGQTYRPGTYIVQAQQGGRQASLKLLKQSQ